MWRVNNGCRREWLINKRKIRRANTRRAHFSPRLEKISPRSLSEHHLRYHFALPFLLFLLCFRWWCGGGVLGQWNSPSMQMSSAPCCFSYTLCLFDPEADYKQPPPYYGFEQKHKYDLFTNGFIIHENTLLQRFCCCCFFLQNFTTTAGKCVYMHTSIQVIIRLFKYPVLLFMHVSIILQS